MANYVTFGGRPVLLDFEQVIASHLEKFQPLNEAVPHAPHRALVDDRRNPRAGIPAFVQLPCFNWPDPPPLKLNQLYWPTGATRWARGYLLMRKADVNILAKLTSKATDGGWPNNVALDFKAETNGRKLETKLYVHSTRKFGDASDKLFVVCLVDERYHWQEKTADFNVTPDSASWDTLVSALTATVSTLTIDTIPSTYLEPDCNELTRRHDNVATLMDAVAGSVGMRVVRNLDGTVKIMTSTSATAIHDANEALTRRILVGGTADVPLPAKTLKVVFPRMNGETPDCQGEVHIEEKDNADFEKGSDTAKVVYSTHFAVFDDDQDSTANNVSTLSDLRAEIGIDYYAWHAGPHFDTVYSGIQDHEISGFQDCTIWTFGVERFNRSQEVLEKTEGQAGQLERVTTTRLISLPPNVGVNHNLSQSKTVDGDAEQWQPSCGVQLYRFTMNEDWGDTTSLAADSDILEIDGTDTTIDADVLDPLGIFAELSNGDAGICFKQNGKYYAIQAPCSTA